MKIQNVKGGYDFLPRKQKIRNYINDILRETFEEYGYGPIETPILCYFDILADKYDEENDILKEIYRLKDQGDRDLGLRYDLTVPFAKCIAINKNELKLPFKRYEIAKVFRDGPVKVGRDREFTQCDVDVVGLAGQYIEAELLLVYAKAFAKLNIDIYMKYNSRKLMTGLILECGVPENLVPNVTTIVDKIDKVSTIEFKQMLLELGLNNQACEDLVKYFKYSLKEMAKEFKDTENENIKVGIEELTLLEKYLDGVGISNICRFTPSLARGQNYYTGNVFEVYEATGKLTGSIGGGGRYDNMITEFISDGESYPAVGISFGLTSIYELLKDSSDFKDQAEVDFYIIPMNTEIESLNIATTLRDIGYKVQIEMTGKKLKKALDYANKENIPYIIIVGEDEIKSGEITIKNMANNTSAKIAIKELKNLEINKCNFA